MFVDSDDVLLPNAIECLLSKAYLEDADIVDGKMAIALIKNGFSWNDQKKNICQKKEINIGEAPV